MVLSWHQPGFVLEGAPTLTGIWRELTRGASINGTDYSATVAAGGSAQFFRLRLDCE